MGSTTRDDDAHPPTHKGRPTEAVEDETEIAPDDVPHRTDERWSAERDEPQVDRAERRPLQVQDVLDLLALL